jgi:flagellar L-ring protein FlgH
MRKEPPQTQKYSRLCLALLACSTLNACATADKLSKIGDAPEMSKISNPVTSPEYQPVSLPMPSHEEISKEKNSLWESNRVTFFKDQRANNIGDIITVTINIKDEATIDNESERTRTAGGGAGVGALLGYEQSLNKVLPEAVDSANLAEFNSDSTFKGTGTIEREDDIKMRMAALITQILPNGNMVIHGKQEVLVNFEKRLLQIDGVIRPQDISVDNTVSYDQIAEARIIYGGEGQISEVQQPKYGQQIYDVIFPF